MRSICFNFLMHIPYQLKQYRFFDIGIDHYYYEDMQTEESVSKMVEVSYLPLCKTLLEMIRLSKQRFHCSLTITGVTLELFEQYYPEMIDVLKALSATSCVEFLATPYSYSLASEYNQDEFIQQLRKQQELVEYLFGASSVSKVVCNTELVYSDELASLLKSKGYKGCLTEGAKHLLSWKSPNYLYCSVEKKFPLMLRNTFLSDELSFHFSDSHWSNYPIDGGSFINRIVSLPEGEQVVPIFCGADTFGFRQSSDTGIFAFLRALPYFGLERGVQFLTPSEVMVQLPAGEVISAMHSVCWTGEAKDLSLFVGNDLQQEVIHKLYAVTERVHLCQDNRLKNDWLILQDINFLHYMNYEDRGLCPYPSAYDAFINYMNVLADFLQCLSEQYPTSIDDEELNELLKTIKNQEEEIISLRGQLNSKTKKTK